MRTITVIDRESNVAGNRRHGTIYPLFSSWAKYDEMISRDSENVEREICKKVTIEDGRFELVSKRKGYTGQHTNLFFDELMTAPVRENELVNIQYLYGEIYTRNQYGAKRAFFRLDCINGTTQYKRGAKWYAFQPSNYID